MRKIGVGLIGASPLHPGWAVTAHLPALASSADFELREVVTSNERSARAAAEAYGVTASFDAESIFGSPNVDLIVVAVKLKYHNALITRGLNAGKMVMCEWPLAIDLQQATELAEHALRARATTLVGLQARMAPSIRYARDLVISGYIGRVLGTTIQGSGIAWTDASDSAHAYMFDADSGASLLSVPVMHAIDAMQFVLGELADLRTVSAIRNPTIKLADRDFTIESSTPDHIAIAASLKDGAVASVYYRGGVSRSQNFYWEINGSEGDLVLTSPIGNLQVIAPLLFGGRSNQATVTPLAVPKEYDFSVRAIEGPAANVARLYAAFAKDLRDGGASKFAPDFHHARKLHETLNRALSAQ